MIKGHLKDKIDAALESLHFEKVDYTLDHPTNITFGDYTTNVAFMLSKEAGKPPRQLAQMIADAIEHGDLIGKTEVAGAGFINIWLTKKVLYKQLTAKSESIQKKNYKILLEFGQPNTHKLPHIGHLFSYIYGESMARIFEHTGNTVIRANYQGDIGLHVAKCLFKVTQRAWDEVKGKPLENQVNYLQKCYQEGSMLYESDENAKKQIQDINNKLFNRDPSIVKIWEETREHNIRYLKELELSLGIKYDRWFYETETGPIGKKIVEEHIGQVFERSDGAVIFRGEEYGLHTRVFINNIGLPTYEAKEMGLYFLKKKEFTFDQAIVSIAKEQFDYQRVVMKAAELVYPELKGKLKPIGFGMINLTTGKMASRTGQIIDALSLIHEVKAHIKSDFKLDNTTLIEKVAFAAIKYSFLRSDAFSDIAFDIKTSVNREGDSGPYLLYTYVRCQSVLAKSEQNSVKLNEDLTLSTEEDTLLRLIYRLDEVVETAATHYSPHLIANYLFELAQRYNLFYQKHQILKAEEPIRTYRMVLTKKVAEVIKKGLYLLGIDTVEKM